MISPRGQLAEERAGEPMGAPVDGSVGPPARGEGDPRAGRVLVLFDGVCNLCNGTVRFILSHDPRGRFCFASQQSPAGIAAYLRAGQSLPMPDSVIVIDDSGVYTHSAAVLHMVDRLGWPYRALLVGKVLPRGVRDWLYGHLARNRYKIFGRRETCSIPPSPGMPWAERFLAV